MCDRKGRSALHLMAASESVHAKKMVSLLLRSGSSVGENSPLPSPPLSPYPPRGFSSDTQDEEAYSPLHVASSEGHRAIIVALVEEGGADVNVRGGKRKDTPLMLSVSSPSN